ncbi:hypothetical protein, partial [Ensifer sp. Root142]|uniref:hypothetical protein n=1 Tax=Ensifer sp. Root142 TaxID=1736461 RepID=UPI001AECAC79
DQAMELRGDFDQAGRPRDPHDTAQYSEMSRELLFQGNSVAVAQVLVGLFPLFPALTKFSP